MPSHADTLTRLAREFVVRDIMIPASDLVCAPGTPEAIELLDRCPDFDMIPLVGQDGLAAYMERGGSGPRLLRMSDLVSDATSILDIVDILTDRRRVFVLVRDRIGGYVHFSDLNRPIVKLPFFVLLEAVERRFFDMLSGVITPQVVETVLGQRRRADLETRMRRQQASGSNLNWAALLGFKELLLCARELGALASEVGDLDALAKVRNLVCHAANEDLLVEQHADVRRLARTKSLCFKLLEDA